jgi:hypothetical protein
LGKPVLIDGNCWVSPAVFDILGLFRAHSSPADRATSISQIKSTVIREPKLQSKKSNLGEHGSALHLGRRGRTVSPSTVAAWLSRIKIIVIREPKLKIEATEDKAR